MKLHSFVLKTGGSSPIVRKVQLAVPAGWTPVHPPGATELAFAEPSGGGMLHVFAALHPSQLTPVLDRMKSEHPSAVPSPPEAMALRGLRPELGERATRFVITGREVGEMVMIEKGETIILLVVVVAPSVWERVQPAVARVYPTVQVGRG